MPEGIGSQMNMNGIPHIVVARRREHDFRVVEVSEGSSLPEAALEEARWLSLDWWGNCFVRNFDWAVGHFRSAVERDLYLLLLVLEGPIAPDRFVVFLRTGEYSRFAFNPFTALERGVFDCAEKFYHARQEKYVRPSWDVPTGGQEKELCAAAERHLAQGGSVLVPCHREIRTLRADIGACMKELTPATCMQINVCSFTNAPRDRLAHFGSILCGWYTTALHRSLREVLEELPSREAGRSE